jgi:hypothetical protein
MPTGFIATAEARERGELGSSDTGLLLVEASGSTVH